MTWTVVVLGTEGEQWNRGEEFDCYLDAVRAMRAVFPKGSSSSVEVGAPGQYPFWANKVDADSGAQPAGWIMRGGS